MFSNIRKNYITIFNKVMKLYVFVVRLSVGISIEMGWAQCTPESRIQSIKSVT